ncbi:uncharacterized protein NECHADRAFT_98282 [Fusarium vanettenii 77-13-4]|uniref:Alpha/beta hydrolase fold-3 domain-containing protein n=1 Tax=Fusarium vanettenii (strain ATCC MYA-4622 / CBS 123669 / FGSC 9596 / NRRL 45880 / 77-13-4) TaxID=660122 RepID=C7ZPY3_FUSV7|nr:uncharacterized protein NECHADRAFT_98282 [Fusarium vanettenii 77-13-4]EEU33933.1 hypothetical protein NECHADRAFT_98282 [Fusarium vanettenii 77-13-4]
MEDVFPKDQPRGRIREPELQSDLRLNLNKFHRSSVSPTTIRFNQQLQELEERCEKWHDIGATEYRRRRKEGRTPLPGATLLPSARSDTIPSREDGRTIPIRVLMPQREDTEVHGIFLHFHGGGWVLNDEESSDVYLQTISDACGLISISLGYRLAPEYPFPAAPKDCLDGAQWLVDNGPRIFGQPLVVIGGESAGANLALQTALGLLRASPSLRRLLSALEAMTRFRSAYLPCEEPAAHTSPDVSPFYAELSGLHLPPLLITCGTEDCLLEDNVFMATRWMMAGGQAVLRIFPGSPHGFILFPSDDVVRFVSSKVSPIYSQLL